MVAKARGAVELHLVMLRTSSACCACTFSFKEKEGLSRQFISPHFVPYILSPASPKPGTI